MVKVLVVGQTPPPQGGQAVMIEKLVNSELANVQLIHVRMGFSAHMNEVGRVRVSKILHLFGVIARIIYRRFADDVRILYYPPAGPDRVPIVRDLFILLSTRWLFQKTIFHFHAGGGSEIYARLPRWHQWLFRGAYFGADAAILLSELSPDDGRRLEAHRERVVPNGIDDPCPQWASPANSHGTQDEPLRILFVGVLRESKGVLVLIEACAELAARGVPFQLNLMGQWDSDEFAARVRERIETLNLGQQVRFLGMLMGDEKLAAFARADVFCFPTFFNCEGFPVVLLEAMAFGLPVVATHWRGIPAIVEESHTGFLVEPNDPQAVAERLAILARDATLRERTGAAGREKFLREFTLSRHLERMREVFLEVADASTAEDRTHAAPAWSRPDNAEVETAGSLELAITADAEFISSGNRR